jgi:pimeloyl-ACP methyl ester carboxylesterase
MPFTHAPDGTRIYFEQHGSGDAVLFVHGSGGNHVSWWQQVAWLRERFTVVTLDLRGFGRSQSDLPEYDTLAFPDDILAVLDATGLSRAVLVGQSVGAVAALRAALRAPQRAAGVVLAHSVGSIDDPELTAMARDDRTAAEQIPVLDRLLSARLRRAEPAKAFLFQQMGTFNVARMPDLRNVSSPGPTVAEVLDSAVPISFLTGANDVVLSERTVRRASDLLPGSTLDVVPDAPHSMYWEAADLFNRAVERVLERVYGDTAAVATGADPRRGDPT